MIARRCILAGTGGLAALATAATAATQGSNLSAQARNGMMQIIRNGSRPSARGPAEYFTGAVRVDPLFQAGNPARVSGGHVTFEPGARSAWHTHPLGQTLIVTSGLGLAQVEGKSIRTSRSRSFKMARTSIGSKRSATNNTGADATVARNLRPPLALRPKRKGNRHETSNRTLTTFAFRFGLNARDPRQRCGGREPLPEGCSDGCAGSRQIHARSPAR